MSEIRCFVIVPTGRVALRLRRFTCTPSDGMPARPSDAACPKGSGHDAWVAFPGPDHGAWPARPRPDGCLESYEDVGPAHDDQRWPGRCGACGEAFPEGAMWQVFQEELYRREDGQPGEWTLRNAPPGAMFDATWWPDKGPDGRALHVCLPPGGGFDYWHIDGPAKGGGGWTRTGTPPNVTATPSILTPRYHGWLRNGLLVDA